MLASQGAKVVVNYTSNAQAADEVVSEIEAMAEMINAEVGEIDILVNNAGVSVNLPFAQQSVEDLAWITGINYWGVMYGCKFFLPLLHAVDEAHMLVQQRLQVLGLRSVMRDRRQPCRDQ